MTAPGPEPLHGWRMRDYDDLIATLRESWLTQGITQDAIARRMGCSRSVAKTLLAGETGHGARRLLDLADALGYDLALIPRDAEPGSDEDAPSARAIQPQEPQNGSGVPASTLGPSEAISGRCACMAFRLDSVEPNGRFWCQCGHDRNDHIHEHAACTREAVMLG
jgi:transcriptional regulator with XRE-family HTH domain